MAKQVAYVVAFDSQTILSGVAPVPPIVDIGFTYLEKVGIKVPAESVTADATVTGTQLDVVLKVGPFTFDLVNIPEPQEVKFLDQLIFSFTQKHPDFSASATLEDVPPAAPVAAAQTAS